MLVRMNESNTARAYQHSGSAVAALTRAVRSRQAFHCCCMRARVVLCVRPTESSVCLCAQGYLPCLWSEAQWQYSHALRQAPRDDVQRVKAP